jgi:serine/threonine protein kinase
MDAWAVGVVVYALMCRALPFGEGVPGGGDDRIDRRIKARGRERERERERKSWLMRIAKGEYEWPSLPPLPQDQTDDNNNTNTNAQSELLRRGTWLAHIPRVRKVVERLLVRDPKKRATLKDLRDDEWLVSESSRVIAEGRLVNRDTIGPMAWQEIE